MNKIYSILSPFRLISIALIIFGIYSLSQKEPNGILGFIGIILIGTSVVLLIMDLLLKYFYKDTKNVLIVETVSAIISFVIFYFKTK